MNLSKLGRKQLVLASLVLALGAAVYLNWQFSGVDRLPTGEEEDTSQLGAAQLVNNAYVETVSDDLEQRVSAVSANAFSEARMDRQNSRDQAMELLEKVLSSVDAGSDERQAAVEQASVIAENILQETNVENLLKAKGFEETIAYLHDGQCSVVVSGDIQDADTLIIQEVVMEQTGVTADQIKIIGAR